MFHFKYALFAALCAFTAAMPSQADQPKAYFQMRGSLFSTPEVVIDGKVYDSSFFRMSGFDFADAMTSNPEAAEYARKHTTYSYWSSGILWGGLGLALGYLFITDADKFEPWIYWGVFGASFFTSLYGGPRKLDRLLR